MPVRDASLLFVNAEGATVLIVTARIAAEERDIRALLRHHGFGRTRRLERFAVAVRKWTVAAFAPPQAAAKRQQRSRSYQASHNGSTTTWSGSASSAKTKAPTSLSEALSPSR